MNKIRKYRPTRTTVKKSYSPKKEKTVAERGYNKEWQRYRFRFLHHNPTCYACGEKATVVDHIIAAKVDWDKYFWNSTNYVPLCKKCHDTVTGMFDRSEKPNSKDKMNWLNRIRQEYGVKSKVKIVPIKRK